MNPLSPPRRRRSISDSAATSPEFEFWSLGGAASNHLPSSPLHSAADLFSHGFLLPSHPDSLPRPEPDPEDPLPSTPDPEPEPELVPNPASITSSSSNHPILSASKRWREIFKRGSNNNSTDRKTGPESSESGTSTERKNKSKKKSGNSSSSNNNNVSSGLGSGSGSSVAELNINIWPFSRSRSAGNGSSGRGKAAVAVAGSRKVSSAPCSRSNSSGESKSRRANWPSSPGRGGVHVGRASPVWQARRSKVSSGSGAGKGRVLNLNVPMCIGYRQQLSCRSDESGGGSGGSGGGGGNNSGGNGNLFGLRGLFGGKKSVLTV